MPKRFKIEISFEIEVVIESPPTASSGVVAVSVQTALSEHACICIEYN